MNEDKSSVVGVNDQEVIDTSGASVETAAEKKERTTAQEYNKAKASNKLSMRVLIYSPFRVYYDGQAFSLSAENLTGPFDILPRHHNFITLLSPCVLAVRRAAEDDEKPLRIRIGGGLLHVKADEVVVFLDI